MSLIASLVIRKEGHGILTVFFAVISVVSIVTIEIGRRKGMKKEVKS